VETVTPEISPSVGQRPMPQERYVAAYVSGLACKAQILVERRDRIREKIVTLSKPIDMFQELKTAELDASRELSNDKRRIAEAVLLDAKAAADFSERSRERLADRLEPLPEPEAYPAAHHTTYNFSVISPPRNGTPLAQSVVKETFWQKILRFLGIRRRRKATPLQ